MSKHAASVGIDFGTSTTLIAESVDQSVRTVPIGHSSVWMETLAGRKANLWVFGAEAEHLPVGDVVRSVKSYITNDGAAPSGGPQLSPDEVDEVIAGVFRATAAAARAADLKLDKRLVRLGCPAQWVGAQRGRLARIAHEAGIEAYVDDMVDEPIAAGVDWIWEQFLAAGRRVRGNVLVIDVGGGTVDVALLQVEFEDVPRISVLACRGAAVAGDAVDDELSYRLREHLAESRRELASDDDRLLAQYLRRAARAAKVRLSSSESARVVLDPPYDHLPAATLTRADLDDALITPLKAMSLQVELTLREANLRAARGNVAAVRDKSMDDLSRDVNHVLLAGGMSQIPAIKERFRELLPHSAFHPATGDLATTRIVNGFARPNAYSSLNLNRPGMDIVLAWTDQWGVEQEEILFPAFQPVYQPYQVLAARPLRYESPPLRLPISGRVPGRVFIRSIGHKVVPLIVEGRTIESFPVTLDGFGGFGMSLDIEGQLNLRENNEVALTLNIPEWPYVRFSGLNTLAQVHATVPASQFQTYLHRLDHHHK